MTGMRAGCPMPMECPAFCHPGSRPFWILLLLGPLRPCPPDQHQQQPSSHLRKLRAGQRRSRPSQKQVKGTEGDEAAVRAGSLAEGGMMEAEMIGNGRSERRLTGTGAVIAETGMLGCTGPDRPSGVSTTCLLTCAGKGKDSVMNDAWMQWDGALRMMVGSSMQALQHRPIAPGSS